MTIENKYDLFIYLPKMRFEKGSFVYQRNENTTHFRGTTLILHGNRVTHAGFRMLTSVNVYHFVFFIMLIYICLLSVALQGWAYVPHSDLVSIILSVYRAHLSHALAVSRLHT